MFEHWLAGARSIKFLKGEGKRDIQCAPSLIDDGDWTDVVANTMGWLGLKDDGTLWFTPPRFGCLPVQAVQIDGSFTKIAAGGVHFLAISSTSKLWSWGAYSSMSLGALGRLNGVETEGIPAQVGTDDWSYISADYHTSFGIKADGTLWAWGQNPYNEIPVSGPVFGEPVQVGTDTNWSKCFQHHAIKTDNTLWGWGFNNIGQVGVGTTSPVGTPTQITGAWSFISTKLGSSFGIKVDGTLWAWGRNSYATLVGADDSVATAPVQYGTDTWSSIVNAGTHVLGTKSDGTLWSWGSGPGGLGVRTCAQGRTRWEGPSVPTQVGSGEDWELVGGSI